MKNEEEKVSTNNNTNVNLLNSLISYNSYTSNDFKKINSSNNIINTSGSQPIIIFKKISKSLTQICHNYKSNQQAKNNYVSDGGLRKKLGKYKSFLSNQVNPVNSNIAQNKNFEESPKTMRSINKKVLVNKKEKPSKSHEKMHINEKNIGKNHEKYKEKNKEKKIFTKKRIEKYQNQNKTKIDHINKESHSQGHFNRKNKVVLQNNFISKSINGINYNTSTNYHKKINKQKVQKKINNNQTDNKNVKIKKDKKENTNKEKEEAEKVLEEKKKKLENVNALIKNGVINIAKEFNILKKLTPKEILTKKKKDFLQEKCIDEININTNEKKEKHQPKININNINIKSIGKNKISNKNSNCLKNRINNKLNISKYNSRYISFLNNNTNINTTNTNLLSNNNIDTQSSNKNFKKITLKPKINQFEFINKIQREQKKLPRHKNQNTSRGIEKYLKINDFEPKLSDSFRHNFTHMNPKIINNNGLEKNIISDLNINRKSTKIKHTKKENRQKLIEDIQDEFPFSHKKSHRSQQEIYKYLKEKRIETKREEENTEKEKQLKAYMTFQNLMNIGKNLDNNITKIFPKFNLVQNRKEIKSHLKLRKEQNEYYIGTESSKNNSTFIDKKEYYLSILESKKFVNKSKIEYKEKDSENNEKNKDNSCKTVKKKIKRGFSTGLFENKKIIDELYTTINKANKIFSKENLNKFKNDLLKTSTEFNNTNYGNIITTNEDNIANSKNNINRKDNYNNSSKKIKSPEIKIDMPNTTYSPNNIYNDKSPVKNINDNNKSYNKKINLSNYVINNINLSEINSQEKIFSYTYSNSLNPIKKSDKKLDKKLVLNLINKILVILKRKIFTFLYKMYFDNYKRKTYTMAFNYLVLICKIYSFRKIENFTRIQEYFEAFQELFKPFIRNKFKQFLQNCQELKLRKFIIRLELFFKYKALNKLFIYCERDFKKEIINYLIITIKKPFNHYFFNKLILLKNTKNKKIENYNTPLFNDNIKQREISTEDLEENYIINEDNIIEEVFYDEVNNIFSNNNDYYSVSHKVKKNAHSIKHMRNNEKREINTHLKLKELLNSENKEKFKILTKIKEPQKFSDQLVNLIIEKILNTEIKPFSPLEKLIPYKSFKYEILSKSQNTSLNNSYISSSCASIDQLSISNSYNDPRIQCLNETLISQMSYNSEFNKTIKDKKREQSMSIYTKIIGPELIKLICNEIKINYNRIYENISTPLRTDFEEIVVALELKNNELLKKNYRILEVKEELKDIISRENIIKKFEKINKKIRKKYNQKIDERFDIFLNLCVIDTAIEIINKERLYGDIGEPFSIYSLRNKVISFKYSKNEPNKIVNLVYKSLMEYINNPIFLIKDSVINADEKKIIKCFKNDLEENECQWKDMEIVETQSKLEVTELILDQLYNEVIEILEHVQLSRKCSDLYQGKSIYACEDIPKLSFQQTTTENELIPDGEGRDNIFY